MIAYPLGSSARRALARAAHPLRRAVFGVVFGCLTSGSLAAQATPPDPSSPRLELFERAQTLVGDGEVTSGRAIVDSLLRVSRSGTPEYAEALYWRAALAATAADAERDYLRVSVEYSSSPYAEDALLRLGMLELARSDRAGAIRRFERIVTNHPEGRQRARAQYWIGRTHFDENRMAEGCSALTAARRATPDDQVELVTQIDYYAQRCRGVAAAPAPGIPPAPTPSRTTPPPPTRTTTPAAPAPAAPAPRPTPAAAPAAMPSAGTAFSVQVAAFPQRESATRFAARLRERGHDARVDGTAAPFRVRIGRFPTREAATARLAELKRQSIDGFVAEVPAR